MVDVGAKEPMRRRAVAEGYFCAAEKTLNLLEVGVDVSAACLLQDFDAICLAAGARCPRDLDVPGREFKGIYLAMDLLRQQNLLEAGELPKGEALAAARLAGIMAAKRCDELIPLCHTLPLDAVNVEFDRTAPDRIRITATASITAKTGVEMEALTAVSVAALTLWDMTKAVDKDLRIDGIHVLKKTKQPAS